MEGRIGDENGKIRKRGCSSSSSSSLVRRYRFKRAILVGKRGGSSTPVPTWKTSCTRTPSPSPTMDNNGEFSKPPSAPRPHRGGDGKRRDVSVSARKLAATLWEINGVTCPSTPDLEATPLRDKKTKERASGFLPKSGSLPPNLSDPSYSPISERMEGSRAGHHRRMSGVSRKNQLTDYYMDSPSNGSVMEVENHSRGLNHAGCMIGVKTRLKDVSNGLTTSKELLKALHRILAPEEQHAASLSLVSALRVELDRARFQVDHLNRELRSNRNDIDYLMKHFAEEKAALKRKERERTRNAIASVADELEVEKKLRRQTERLNKKLGKELADTKATLSKALKELDTEKRAKDILEQVCDELASGIGDDRAEVEQLKKESEKVREEVEKEREMLQLADVLREERVQMKLSEAKYQFEEKNAAVERLRNQLEAYLRTKLGDENIDDGSPKSERSKELHAFLRQTNIGSCKIGDREEDAGEVDNGDGDGDGDEDSADSDMHSIELSMDNSNRIYNWSYAYGEEDAQDDSKRSSVDRDFRGRKSISEKIQWGNICLKRSSSHKDKDKDKDMSSTKSAENSDCPEVVSQDQIKEYEEEIKRYKSLKSLRDHILSGSKMASVGSFASPTRSWGQSLGSNGGIASANLETKQQVGARGEHGRTSTSSRQ